jgi:hypothetical protein
MQVAMRGLVWYHTCMSTTHNNEETTRPEPKPTGSRENRWEIAGYGEQAKPCCCVCGADHVDDDVRATEYGAMCVMCVEDVRADMCADAHERDMGDCYWDRVRECDSDAYADSIDRD